LLPVAAGRGGRRRSWCRRARRWLANLGGLLVAVVMLFPVYWMVLTALKPPGEVLTLTPRFWPSHFSLASFRKAIGSPHFGDAVRNSLVVAFSVTVIALAVAFCARCDRALPVLRPAGSSSRSWSCRWSR